MISIIAVIDKNNALGKDNKLLCHLPKDLKRFKEATLNQVVIMGRKTFESLPVRPLPKRISIVITRDKGFACEGAYVANDTESAVLLAKELLNKNEEAKEIFIMGGGQIYKQFMENNLADRLLLTKVNASFEADTYFPQIDDTWKVKESFTEVDNDFETEFVIYEKAQIS